MQDAARDEYAHAICALGEIIPIPTDERLCYEVCPGIGTLRVPRTDTNIKSALYWNAKLEGKREFCSKSLLMQDASRDEYAHAICTLGEIVRSGYGWKHMRSGLPGY
jgi:hypothetical protein